ncbi:hypothetical protein [Streptomyces eurythermus]|uniref:hypothetical protein n=1 Tax=Streptomyces eurythermus TaxID=42237 RepID=UPI0036F57565
MRRITFGSAIVAAVIVGAGAGFAQGNSEAASKAPFTQHFEERQLRPGELARIEVPCPFGTVPTGGGFNVAADVVVQTSAPQPNNWLVVAKNTTNVFKGARAYVVCSTP